MPTPSCHRIFTRSPLRPRKQKISRHADRAPTLPEPAAPACSCPDAYLSRRQRSRPSRPPEKRSLTIHHRQKPGKRFRVHSGRHDHPAAIWQRNLDLTVPKGWTRINRSRLRGWSPLRHSDRRERYRTASAKFSVPILPTPSCQQRPTNAMPPRRGSHLPVADKTLLDNPELVIIRPMPTADTIGRRENFNLRAASKVGHKVGLIIGSRDASDGRRRSLTS